MFIWPNILCICSRSCFKWTLEVLHWSLHTTLGYILMLAVMTYNAYITIAIVIGGCLGYWIFGLTLVQLNMQRFRHKPEVECDKNCDGKFKHLQKDNYSKFIIVIAYRYFYKPTETCINCFCCCRTISHWGNHWISLTKQCLRLPNTAKSLILSRIIVAVIVTLSHYIFTYLYTFLYRYFILINTN